MIGPIFTYDKFYILNIIVAMLELVAPYEYDTPNMTMKTALPDGSTIRTEHYMSDGEVVE